MKMAELQNYAKSLGAGRQDLHDLLWRRDALIKLILRLEEAKPSAWIQVQFFIAQCGFSSVNAKSREDRELIVKESLTQHAQIKNCSLRWPGRRNNQIKN